MIRFDSDFWSSVTVLKLRKCKTWEPNPISSCWLNWIPRKGKSKLNFFFLLLLHTHLLFPRKMIRKLENNNKSWGFLALQLAKCVLKSNEIGADMIQFPAETILSISITFQQAQWVNISANPSKNHIKICNTM